MSDKVRIELVRVGELVDYERARREASPKAGVSPITPVRALAQSRNPNATADDIGLIAAMRGDECIGHVSILPGKLRITEDKVIKVAWSHAYFVHPDFRNGVVAFLLLKKLTRLGLDIFVTGFNEPSRAICSAFGFKDFGPLEYVELDLRSLDVFAAIRKRTNWKFMRRGVIGGLIYAHRRDSLLLRGIQRLKAASTTTSTWRTVRNLTYIERQCKSPYFERHVDCINWMLNNPWIRSTGERCNPPYYFSDLREEHRYIPVEFRDQEGNYCGFVVFLVTEKNGKRTLKTLDFLVTGQEIWMVIDAALQFAKQNRVDRIIFPKNALEIVSKIFGSRLVKKRRRQYQWFPRVDSEIPISNGPSNITLQYYDGDCAFG